jgi:hypothetical protein
LAHQRRRLFDLIPTRFVSEGLWSRTRQFLSLTDVRVVKSHEIKNPLDQWGEE